MIRTLIALICLASSTLLANIGPGGFHAFKNQYFVETGTFGGDGIKKALQAGFKNIRSIEINHRLAKEAQFNFKKNTNIVIREGDSSTQLFDMIKDIKQPITFWLDGHVYPPRTDGGKNCPLIEELEQIKRHPIKTHTILIDDMHCCNTIFFDNLTREDLIAKIHEINPDYQIRYVPGGNVGEYPANVMVAQILDRG